VDLKSLSQATFGGRAADALIGTYRDCYIGHATDYDIRFNASSGGLISAVLTYALEEGRIDGALVTIMGKENPLEPQPFIATTAQDIISASGAKYCPVPTNIAIREILRKEGSYAVVGLPCQIHGIRKAETTQKKLKDRIVLHLGIFCNHTPSFWATRLLLTRLGVEPRQVAKIDYRGHGWPGAMAVQLKDGSTKMLPQQDSWAFLGSDFFTSKRCLMCCDHTCELADISFGDAWNLGLPEGVGSSAVVARTKKGQDLLQEANAKGVLTIEPATVEQVKQSQLQMLYVKKKVLKARMKLYRTKVEIDADLIDPDASDYLLALAPCFVNALSQTGLVRTLVNRVPQRLLLLYMLPVNHLFYKKLQKWKVN
jgi:coenzyme F420 hydrogenase subunit beta